VSNYKNMKLVRLFLVFAFMLAPTFVFADVGPNLIKNPNFDVSSNGWSPVIGRYNSTSFSYPTQGNSGNGAKIVVSNYYSGDIFWQPTVAPVSAGKQYAFSGYSLNSVPVSVVATYVNSTGSAVSYATLGTVPASSSWQKFNATVTIPTGVTGVRIQHVIRSRGTLAIDSYFLGLVSGATSTPPTATTTPPTATSTPPTATTTPPVVVKPTINSFTANPANITAGQSATLSWSVASATKLVIDQGVGTVSGTSKVVTPSATTTYTLSAVNSAGTTTKSVVVNVAPVVVTPPPPPPSNNLIQNGDLESGTTNAPTNWQGDYWGTMTPTFTYPVTGKNGGKAARTTVTNYQEGDAKWYFTHIPVSSHTMYQYTEDYLSSAVTNVTVEFKMSDGTFEYQWVQSPAASSGWSTLSIPITVPTGAVSMTVLHALTSNGTLTIDNASLVAKTNNTFTQGMVTFAFDDGLLSQYQNALPILTSAGVKGGFHIITTEPASGDSAYMTWAQIKDVKAKGHEVGGHTRTHADLTTLGASQLQSEVAGSYSDLVAQGITPKAFLYPLGAVNEAVKTAVKNAGYTVARGSYYGQNDNEADHYNLFDIRLDKTSTLTKVQQQIDQAVADKRWLVFEIHDVLPSGGDDFAISTSFFQSVVNYVKQKSAKVVTLEQGLAELK
jgi:peptidoglycan/xylan/chitin deacetylase (PgdA/CDA1 family)